MIYAGIWDMHFRLCSGVSLSDMFTTSIILIKYNDDYSLTSCIFYGVLCSASGSVVERNYSAAVVNHPLVSLLEDTPMIVMGTVPLCSFVFCIVHLVSFGSRKDFLRLHRLYY